MRKESATGLTEAEGLFRPRIPYFISLHESSSTDDAPNKAFAMAALSRIPTFRPMKLYQACHEFESKQTASLVEGTVRTAKVTTILVVL